MCFSSNCAHLCCAPQAISRACASSLCLRRAENDTSLQISICRPWLSSFPPPPSRSSSSGVSSWSSNAGSKKWYAKIHIWYAIYACYAEIHHLRKNHIPVLKMFTQKHRVYAIIHCIRNYMSIRSIRNIRKNSVFYAMIRKYNCVWLLLGEGGTYPYSRVARIVA